MVPRIMDNHWSGGITIKQQPYCTLTTVASTHISLLSGHLRKMFLQHPQ